MRPIAPFALGSSITLGPTGIGCVGHEFTPGALLTGTLTSLTCVSGLPVSRSRIQVQPNLVISASAGRVTTLPLTLNLPVNSTGGFGRSASQRS